MPDILPPAPIDAPFASYNWTDWYKKVRDAINNASVVSWSAVTGTPTTLAGYGITDAQKGLQFQDEGSNLGASGSATTVNFVGTGVTASRTGDTIKVDVSAGGGLTTSATITVPNNSYEHSEIVTFTGCTPTTKIITQIEKHADTDENDYEGLDVIGVAAVAGTNQATVYISFRERASGPIKLTLIGV